MTYARLTALWVGMHFVAARGRLRRAGPDDRGDVPGWVMVTVMTAALVVAILAVFKSKIVNAVNHAIDSVTGAG